MRRSDPRIRQTLNQISSTLETANLNTQASLYTISQSYLAPCLSSLNTCLEASCYPCLGARRESERRRAARSRGASRPEQIFDFYDDWAYDDETGEGSGLLGGWGNDELDRLLAGSGSREDGQPSRQRRMSYGASRGGLKRKMTLPSGKDDPTVVPGSSMFGFLERLPWKIGGRGMRYRPSAADLQDNPGGKKWREGGHEDGGEGGEEREALLEESDGENKSAATKKGHMRNRSDTATSRSTLNSLSSRGDLFPSEDEDDAVPLDDEFAMALERRNTSDEASSGKTRGKRRAGSRASTKTDSSKETRYGPKRKRGTSVGSGMVQEASEDPELPSIEALKEEEEAVRREEETEVERKREAAEKLAEERGLVSETHDPDSVESRKPTNANLPAAGGKDGSTPQQPEPDIPTSPKSTAKPHETPTPSPVDAGTVGGNENATS